jgi:hypothetical protein
MSCGIDRCLSSHGNNPSSFLDATAMLELASHEGTPAPSCVSRNYRPYKIGTTSQQAMPVSPLSNVKCRRQTFSRPTWRPE